MNELLQSHLKLENDLRHALLNHQLHLHYQPQIDLVTGSLYGVEALPFRDLIEKLKELQSRINNIQWK